MRQAFTLIELTISLGMLAILLAILSGVLVTILDTHLSAGMVSAVESDAQYLFNRLHYDKTILGYVWDGQNLSRGGIRLNGPKTLVSSFTVTPVGSTTRINFTLVSDEESRSYLTTIGQR